MSYNYLGELAAMVDEDPRIEQLAELLQKGKMSNCNVDSSDGGDLEMSVTFTDGSVFKVLVPNICDPGDFYRGDVDALTEHLMDVMEIS